MVSDQITQVDIGSGQPVNIPKFLIGAYQTRLRTETAKKINKIAIFDNLDHRK